MSRNRYHNGGMDLEGWFIIFAFLLSVLVISLCIGKGLSEDVKRKRVQHHVPAQITATPQPLQDSVVHGVFKTDSGYHIYNALDASVQAHLLSLKKGDQVYIDVNGWEQLVGIEQDPPAPK